MLREAAVVAAMVGSVGMVGAGVASAGEWEPPQLPNITCNQTNGDTEGDVDAPLLAALTGGGGNADSRNLQNNCGVGIIGNDQTSGPATGGDSSAV
ncbi:hypothetical protein G4Z16_14585 [Streptomyces bathyalis]|uniref:Chaplin domain-containing protein n=1 Tax=Streptomyces bathyalis TaxID=2710756 RepID=A0A7T1WSD1_9ACTN|nr:hypothetical protein [Streptomyces bathyalis]QPP07406.1 hypothetical protein G4Z16_14585 [Streptomyces bathyalis]